MAFFERLGDLGLAGGGRLSRNGRPWAENAVHNAYRKTTFVIVHVRTDGERVLMATHSGRDDQKPSYAFRVSAQGDVQFEPATRVV